MSRFISEMIQDRAKVISKMIQDRAKVIMERVIYRIVTLSGLAKYSMTKSIERPVCNS